MPSKAITVAYDDFIATHGVKPDVIFLSRNHFRRLIEAESKLGVPTLVQRYGDWLIKGCIVILRDTAETPIQFWGYDELVLSLQRPSPAIPYTLQADFGMHYALHHGYSRHYQKLQHRLEAVRRGGEVF